MRLLRFERLRDLSHFSRELALLLKAIYCLLLGVLKHLLRV